MWRRLLLIFVLLGAGAWVYLNRASLMDRYRRFQIDRAVALSLEQQLPTQAVAVLQTAQRQYPTQADFPRRLAELAATLNQTVTARKAYEDSLKLRPEDIDTRIAFARWLAQDPHRRNEAVQVLWEGLRQDRGEPRLLGALGDMFREAANHPRESRAQMRRWLNRWALYYYLRAVHANPSRFDTRFQLASLALKLGDPKRAALHFCAASMLNDHSIEAKANLGLALVELGALDPGFRLIQQGVQALSDQQRLEDARRLAELSQTMRAEHQEDAHPLSAEDGARLLGLPATCLPSAVSPEGHPAG